MDNLYEILGIDFFKGRVDIAEKVVEMASSPEKREGIIEKFEGKFPIETHKEMHDDLSKLIIGLYSDNDFLSEIGKISDKRGVFLKTPYDEKLICDATLHYFAEMEKTNPRKNYE